MVSAVEVLNPRISSSNIEEILNECAAQLALGSDTLTMIEIDDSISESTFKNIDKLFKAQLEAIHSVNNDKIDFLLIDQQDWLTVVVFCLSCFKRDSDGGLLCYLDNDIAKSKCRSWSPNANIYVKFHLMYAKKKDRQEISEFIRSHRLEDLICVHPMPFDKINDNLSDFKKHLNGKLLCLAILFSIMLSISRFDGYRSAANSPKL